MEDFILPMREDNEFVGRTIDNVFDIPEIVRLPKAWWNYFDWCISELDYDMVEWIKYIDLIRPADVSFDLHLWRNLWEHECRRYFHGYQCPTSQPPEGYTDFVEALDKEEQCPKRHEWVGRQFENSDGVDELVEMQSKHWQYFDYLIELGGDMNKWVKRADLARHDTQNTLSAEIMSSLIRHERKSYLESGHHPLFITIKGYPRPLNVELPTKQN